MTGRVASDSTDRTVGTCGVSWTARLCGVVWCLFLSVLSAHFVTLLLPGLVPFRFDGFFQVAVYNSCPQSALYKYSNPIYHPYGNGGFAAVFGGVESDRQGMTKMGLWGSIKGPQISRKTGKRGQ